MEFKVQGINYSNQNKSAVLSNELTAHKSLISLV